MVFIGYKFEENKRGLFHERIAYFVARYLKKSGKRYDHLAKELAINKCQISRWCHGISRPSEMRLDELCKAIGIKKSSLYRNFKQINEK